MSRDGYLVLHRPAPAARPCPVSDWRPCPVSDCKAAPAVDGDSCVIQAAATADGVPVVLGKTEIWYNQEGHGVINLGVAFCVTVGMRHGPPYVIAGDSTAVDLRYCYSTESAAKSARG